MVTPARARKEAAELEAKGQAATIIEDGNASIEVFRRLVEQYQAAGPDAQRIFVLNMLPELVDRIDGIADKVAWAIILAALILGTAIMLSQSDRIPDPLMLLLDTGMAFDGAMVYNPRLADSIQLEDPIEVVHESQKAQRHRERGVFRIPPGRKGVG